jgi:hypothetical protein
MNEWGLWDAENPGARKRGYHISQFNSPTMSLENIMESYFAGLKDAKKMKSFTEPVDWCRTRHLAIRSPRSF